MCSTIDESITFYIVELQRWAARTEPEWKSADLYSIGTTVAQVGGGAHKPHNHYDNDIHGVGYPSMPI